MTSQTEKAARFQELHHRPGAFIIPNPWDAGTARLRTSLGFEALATTSLGLAITLGRGTVTHVDRASRTVAIKMDNGADATYKLGSEGVVETEHGVVRADRYVAKEGDKVVVHYTEDAGGKLVRFFKKI